MDKGKLIVIEGSCDGIGKSTQKELIEQKFKDANYEIHSHHFPTYGSSQAKLVEMYLHGDFGAVEDLSPYFVTFLFAMDRSVTWLTDLKKYYEDGKIILLDRYTTSSLIYQSAMIDDINKKKEFIDYVTNYEYNILQTKEPDMVIFLRAPYDVVEGFRNKRNEELSVEKDIHEQDTVFMKKVYDNANFIAEYLNWTIIDYVDDKQGRIKTIEEINEEITDQINNKLKINLKRVLK